MSIKQNDIDILEKMKIREYTQEKKILKVGKTGETKTFGI